MQYYIDFWMNYTNFSGCTSRRGYWMAYLFNFLIALAVSVIIAILPDLALLSTVYTLATLVPGIAITVRRLRDTGKNWPWIFIVFVPLAGPFILLYFLCKPSAAA